MWRTGRQTDLLYQYRASLCWRAINKCIGDDTKAAARQSLNCIKNKKNIIWRKTIFNTADGILTPFNVARTRHWFRQVTAPCNVIRASGMTCHWIRPNVRHIGILHLISITTHHRSRHVILQYQSAKFYPNRTTLGRKKWSHVDFQDGLYPPS